MTEYRMKVPLKWDNPEVDGETVFVVWDGSPGHFHRHERRPGFWSATADGRVVETAEKRRLSDVSAPPQTWYRLAFDTWKEAHGYAEQREKEGYGSYLGDVDRYSLRVLVEDPDYLRQWPMQRPLRILAVDIEQRTDGTGFPPQDAPMVSMSLNRCDGTGDQVVVAEDDGNGEPDDKNVVQAWYKALQEFDPDIIVGFNVHYDLGVLVARTAAHGYTYKHWGRHMANGELAYSHTVEKFNPRFKKYDTTYYIGGRIVWDTQANANALSDYNLTGCKDFKLKTIAAFLGWPALTEDTKNTLALWRDRPDDLVRYNANDTDLVRRQVERYLPDRIGMAEFFGAPLAMTIDVATGWAGTIASARNLYEQDILSDGKNVERHLDYLKFDIDKDGSEKVRSFQGARVRLHKAGLFNPIYKADFSSYYPHIIINVGCGPDNTQIVGTQPLGPFVSLRDGDTLKLSIPDTKYDHNWQIEVRGRSRFADYVEKRMDERLAAKDAGEADRAAILKSVLNANFGVQGSLSARYGVLPVAIICTGVARVLMEALEAAAGDACVETDTDGVYLDRPVPVPLMRRAVEKRAEELGLGTRLPLDLDEYEGAWFHETKVYLLLEKDKDGGEPRLLLHGNAFKGRQHPGVFDRVVQRVGRALLMEGREAALVEARASLDFDNYEPADFVQRATLGKPITAYKHDTKEVKIARAYEDELGIPPTPGRSYEYVRTRAGMVPPTPVNLEQLDEHAYLSRVIIPALGRLGFTDLAELGMEDRVQTAKARSKRPAGETSLAAWGANS